MLYGDSELINALHIETNSKGTMPILKYQH